MRLKITNLFLLLTMLVTGGCFSGKKDDYTSKTYYERSSRFILPDKYVETVVAVPVDNRVPPAFVVQRDLYERQGDKFRKVSVDTVNMELYEASEMRRREVTDTLYTFFRRLMMLGVVVGVLGVLLFFVSMKFPIIPSVWDEMVFFGAISGSLGLVGSWYVDQIIFVGILTGIAVLLSVVYILVRDSVMHRKLKARDTAALELTDTVQTLKKVDRKSWDSAKKVISQSETTKKLVRTYRRKLEKGETKSLHSNAVKSESTP